ncbi:MAG: hypothetical protein LBB82_03925 [Treponema sp.]|jgi:hypothetical protein|nr:hypothetical protein [Treponema sp.]
MKRVFRQVKLWTLAALLLAGCSTETALQKLLGVSAAAPVFYGCHAAENGQVEFRFSVPVTIKSVYFDRVVELESRTEGETVSIVIAGDLPPGTLINMDMLVEDKRGNTLNVLVPFRTRNNRMPALLVNELRLTATKPKTEFVELRAMGAGNLGALRLFAANKMGKIPLFEFPPVEIQAGEYIVVHTRDYPNESGHVNETEGLNKSSGTDALRSARDFWVPGTTKLLYDTDAIYLCDQDDRVIDAVVFAANGKKQNEDVTAAITFLAGQEAWNSAEISDAADSTGHTATRTVNRVRAGTDTNSAGDWFVGATSTASPGAVNTANRYYP